MRIPENYVIGIDLGRDRNHSAFTTSALFKHIADRPNPVDWSRDVRWTLEFLHIHRFPLGTDYLTVVAKLQRLITRINARTMYGIKPPTIYVIIDSAGPGQVAVELLRRKRLGVLISPAVITGGENVGSSRSGGYTIPRKELLATLRLLLEKKIVRVSRRIHCRRHFMRELAAVRVDGSQNEQDDIVIAASLNAWFANKIYRIY